MLLVCLAHFSDVYFNPLGLGHVSDTLDVLTLTATPTFVLISGIVLGFLYSTAPSQRALERLTQKLVDRALFLLVVAHVLIVLANMPRSGPAAFRIVFITDVVALCLVIGTRLLARLSGAWRTVIGVGSYLGSTATAFLWLPHLGPAKVIKHLLVGNRPELEPSVFAYNFPVLQWLGLYLCATALGEWMGRSRTLFDGQVRGLVALVGIGALLVAGALTVRYLRPVALRLLGTASAARSAVVALTSSTQKLPPAPVYLLFYAGLGLCVVAVCLWLSRLGLLHAPVGLLALVGRNSLVAFVLQYFVYYVAVFLLRLPYTPFWPALFAAGFALVIAGSGAWERWFGPRWLTVGYPALRARAAGRPIAAAVLSHGQP
jgi:hypothetical protein